MLIYKITNKLNNKIYIGQTTKSIKQRWKGHIDDARISRYHSMLLRAINKHGFENFSIEVVEYVNDRNSLNEREIYWIDYYNSTDKTLGYNILKGGAGNKPRPPASDEQKLKNSLVMQERIKLGFKGHTGYTHNDETKKRISEKKKGRNDYSKEALEEKSKRWRDKGSPTYKDVDEIKLLDVLIESPDMYLNDIAKVFDVSKQTLISKIKRLFGCNLSSIKVEYADNILDYYKKMKEKIEYEQNLQPRNYITT